MHPHFKSWKDLLQRRIDNTVSCALHFIMQALRRSGPRCIVRRCDRAYLRVAQKRGAIPSSLRLHTVQITTAFQFAGGSANIHRGRLRGADIAVKIPRTCQSNTKATMKVFTKEYLIMESLGPHPHIIDLLGVFLYKSDLLCIVTPWMERGTVAKVIRSKTTPRYRNNLACVELRSLGFPDKLTELDQVKQIADGMAFLEASNVIHGDIKGENILVDQAGNARIADFGLSRFGEWPASLLPIDTFISNPSSGTFLTTTSDSSENTTTHSGAGSSRWMAPERLMPEHWGNLSGKPTFESDVFAFGMVIYEIFSGEVPFHEANNYMAMLSIVQGRRPVRPILIADDLWNIAMRSWNAMPTLRPSIHCIHNQLGQAARNDPVSASFVPTDGPTGNTGVTKVRYFQSAGGTIPSRLEISYLGPDASESFPVSGLLSRASMPEFSLGRTKIIVDYFLKALLTIIPDGAV